MRWLRRPRAIVWWLNHAAWPDGMPWPNGPPKLRRDIRASTLASLVAVGLAVALGAAGVPEVLCIVMLLLFGIGPIAVYVIWRVVSEARRQGWGSNLPDF